MHAIGYIRVSTEGQRDSGLSLDAQRERLAAEAERRGWNLSVYHDTATGRNTNRPGLAAALEELQAHRANVLMVTALDRLSRSVIDFAYTVRRAEREGWILLVLDLNLDMSTANGKMQAGILSVLAEWESNIISQRTKQAMRQLPVEGRNGREVYPEKVRLRIRELRDSGLSFRKTGEALEAEGLHALSGNGWHPQTLKQICSASL